MSPAGGWPGPGGKPLGRCVAPRCDPIVRGVRDRRDRARPASL